MANRVACHTSRDVAKVFRIGGAADPFPPLHSLLAVPNGKCDENRLPTVIRQGAAPFLRYAGHSEADAKWPSSTPTVLRNASPTSIPMRIALTSPLCHSDSSDRLRVVYVNHPSPLAVVANCYSAELAI